jgi:lysophospholipase L1-like esterase
LGFRGRETTVEKPAGRYRVVVLGGSSAWGLGSTSDERSVPGRLEALLREQHPDRDIEVINAGQPGFTSAQELIYFHRHISRLSPDLVLLFDGYNDIDADLFNAHAGWPENAALLQSRYGQPFDLHRLRRDLAPILHQSRVVDFTLRKIRSAGAAGTVHPSAIPATVTAENYINNVKAIARLAAPAPVWVALQPTLATTEKPLAPRELQRIQEREKTIPGFSDRLNAAFRQMARKSQSAGLPTIDLSGALGHAPKLMFADECHFGDEAADRLARRIAESLPKAPDRRNVGMPMIP